MTGTVNRRRRLVVAVGVTVLLVGAVLWRSSQSDGGDGGEDDRTLEPAAAVVGDGDEAGEGRRSRSTQLTVAVDAVVGMEEGAVRAALEFAVAPQLWLYLPDDELEAEIRRVAAPGSVDELVDEVVAEVGLARDALAKSPGRIWWVVRPLAWRVDSFTPERAQISVWTVSVLSAADVAMPQSDWQTTLFDLDWDGEAWRLVATRDTPGPTPQLGGRDQPWEPEPFDDALDGFQRVGTEASS